MKWQVYRAETSSGSSSEDMSLLQLGICFNSKSNAFSTDGDNVLVRITEHSSNATITLSFLNKTISVSDIFQMSFP